MPLKYRLYVLGITLGSISGIYTIRRMFVDWLEFGELLRYILIRLPLAIIILLMSIALRKRYLGSLNVNLLKHESGAILTIILFIGFIVSVLLFLPPNVYYWFII